MDGGSYETDTYSDPDFDPAYENCHIGRRTPDVVNTRHTPVVTSQPSSKAPVREPDNDVSKRGSSDVKNDVSRIDPEGSRAGSDVLKTGNDVLRRDRHSVLGTRRSGLGVYALEGEQTNREWASDLFFSVTGKPHNRSWKDNVKTALRDCGMLSCMMCSIATRLGDPGYLPFVPCTGPAIRFKVRILGGITGTIGNDCLVTTCCCPCAVCQMHREMDDIGL